MADWPPVIDADGHVLERQSDIRKYLEPPWDRRNTGLWPSDQPFDTDLFDTLGYRGYDRGMSPAQQVETWLKIMDEYNIEEAVLFPTGSGNIPKLREPEFCIAACRAANNPFARFTMRLSTSNGSRGARKASSMACDKIAFADTGPPTNGSG